MQSSIQWLRVTKRRAAVLAVGALVAVLTSGCSSFITQPSGSQATTNGQVQVTSIICLAGFDSNTQPGGANADYSQSCVPSAASAEGAEQGQMLIAYLIPNGSGAPTQLTSPDLSGVSFTPSSSYLAWLDANEATPSGYQWAAYMSSEFGDANPEEVDLTAGFTVPSGSGGNAYSGPYVVKRVVIGDRADGPYGSTTLDPARALNCAEVVDDVISVPSPGTSQTLRTAPTGCDNDASTAPLSIDTREFIVAAASAHTTVQAGDTASVPFTIQFAGAAAGPFALSASSSNGALVATPVNSNYAPGGSGTTAEDVSVYVPAGLTPGTYTITLNVGGLGSGSATLEVSAATTTPGSGPAPGPTGSGGGTSSTPTTITTTPTGPARQGHLIRPRLSSVRWLRFAQLRLTQTLNIPAAERLTLQRRRGHRWIRLKELAFRERGGRRTLSLRALFGAQRFKQAGQYRLLMQAFNGPLKSNLRSVDFTIRSGGRP